VTGTAVSVTMRRKLDCALYEAYSLHSTSAVHTFEQVASSMLEKSTRPLPLRSQFDAVSPGQYTPHGVVPHIAGIIGTVHFPAMQASVTAHFGTTPGPMCLPTCTLTVPPVCTRTSADVYLKSTPTFASSPAARTRGSGTKHGRAG